MQAPTPGDIFEGRYEVTQLLGQGGFATVVRATDRENGRDVAIKVLMAAEDPNSSVVARFHREAQIMSQLRCPHTLQMFDFAESAQGWPFIVFEYIAGSTLREVLNQRGTLSEREAVSVLKQLLRSLQEAHGLGVLHRDLKPSNIMVVDGDDGDLHVKLLDFGIADVLPEAGGSALTRTGHQVGTVRYMAPEQMYLEPITPATDIYALGLVGYEMLMGRPAHGETQQQAMEVIASSRSVELPVGVCTARLRDVLHRMLEKDVADRYGDVAQILRALRGSESQKKRRHTRTDGRRRRKRRATRQWFAVAAMAWTAIALAWCSIRNDPSSTARTPRTHASPAKFVRAEVRPPSTVEVAAPADLDMEADLTREIGNGCGKAHEFADDLPLLLPGGRTVLMSVPRAYDPTFRYPLVLSFQTSYLSPGQYVTRSDLRRMNTGEGGVLVAAVVPLDRFDAFEGEDVGVAEETIATIQRSYCVDADRVYALGHGSGARMARDVACSLPLAGLALVGFADREGFDVCEPMQPTPTIWIRGQQDDVYPPGGTGCMGGVFASAAETDRRMRQTHQCRGKSRHWNEHCRVWTRCDAAYAVCNPPGGYHLSDTGWKHVYFGCKNIPVGIKIGPIIWEFFTKYGAPR